MAELTPPRDIRFIEQKDRVECRLKSVPVRSFFMIPFSIFWMGLMFKICSTGYHPSDLKILAIIWLVISSPGFIVFFIGFGSLFNHQSIFITNDRITHLKRSLPWPSRYHLLLEGLTNAQCIVRTYQRSSLRREQNLGLAFERFDYILRFFFGTDKKTDWNINLSKNQAEFIVRCLQDKFNLPESLSKDNMSDSFGKV